jgi:hypothetical protein
MAHPPRDHDGKPLTSMGRVLDSRWMMAFSVLAVLVAIAWALIERGPEAGGGMTPTPEAQMATVELLGVPAGAEVSLDGRRIENTLFGVPPGTRHALEVTDGTGRSWRQVFLADGSLSMVVELRTHFVEVEVDPTEKD